MDINHGLYWLFYKVIGVKNIRPFYKPSPYKTKPNQSGLGHWHFRAVFDWVSLKQKPKQSQQPIIARTISPRELKAKQANYLKRGKTRMTKSWLVLVLHLIGWEVDASFLDQSQSEVKQNQSNSGLLSKFN